MTTAPTPDNPGPIAPPTGKPRLRTFVYCIVLGVLAAVLMFWELGADSLANDEAQYALVIQNIKQSGEWVDVSPYPPQPYLQKPPLYFWLSAITYDVFGGSEFAYRAWSAAAGVGAVVLTCLLGAMLLSPEVGGVAGLLLLLNRSFLLEHGARTGTFDSLLTLFTVSCAVIYWATRHGRRAWVGWIVIGVITGLASITKPFAGVPILLLLAIHACVADRQSPWRNRLLGPLLAVVILIGTASPWFIVQWKRHPHFADEVIKRNLVERATHGVDNHNVKRWTFYPQELTKSSVPFLIVIPASLYVVCASVRGGRRSEHALVALTGVGWVVFFSLSAGKAIHYAYPALPALAIGIAAGAGSLAAWFANHRGPASRARCTMLAGCLFGAAFAGDYVWTLCRVLPAERSPYVPWAMHKALSPAIDSGEARVVFAGFPDHQIDWRTLLQLRARDCYYVEQMRRGATWTRTKAEVDGVLAERHPTLLVIARGPDAESILAEMERAGRLDRRFVYPHVGYFVAGIDLQPLVEPTLKTGEKGRHVTFDGEPSPGTFRFTATPPLRGGASVGVTFRLPEGVPDGKFRYTFTLTAPDGNRKRFEDHFAISTGGQLRVAGLVEEALWSGTSPHVITLTLKRADALGTEPVAFQFQEFRLTMHPHIPAEAHPRR